MRRSPEVGGPFPPVVLQIHYITGMDEGKARKRTEHHHSASIWTITVRAHSAAWEEHELLVLGCGTK